MITFSIITVTYNAEQFLPRTIESVRSLDYPHIQHIIVDGASKDSTLDIARSYKQDCSDRYVIQIQSEPDRGLYDAMNKGIGLATGDYVIFMNAGDCFHAPDTLSKTAASIGIKDGTRNLPAVIYGDTDVMDNEGNYLFRRRLTPPDKLNWKSFRWGMLVCHQSFYCRSDIARQYSYDLTYRHSGDIDWCLRVMKHASSKGLTLHNTHLTLTNYLREGDSTINHRASLNERFCIMKKHYGLFQTIVLHIWFVFRMLVK